MRSILHRKDGTCYLCQLLHGCDDTYSYTEEHHVFEGKANRRLSERHGLKVYLCVPHHRLGDEAAQTNIRVQEILKRIAQEKFEETHSREEFRAVFGKNWLEGE